MSNVNGFTTSKTLKGCHFNRVFFKDMSKTRVMNHTSTARIDSMMAVAKMFDNEVSAERKASMFLLHADTRSLYLHLYSNQKK